MNLIPPEQRRVQRPPMYRSKYDPTMPPTGSTFGLGGSSRVPGASLGDEPAASKVATAGGFGPKENRRKNPRSFTKKGAGPSGGKGASSAAKPAKWTRPTAASKKPTVPSRSEAPVMGLHTTKNFVVANAVENILAVPKNTASAEDDWLRKADYGKRPAYLDTVKAEREAEAQMIMELQQSYEEEDAGLPQARALSAEERGVMIDALKAKWGTVNAKYQKMAHNVTLDTIGKVRRKEELEKALHTIENDIERLERHGDIFVVDDQQ